MVHHFLAIASLLLLAGCAAVHERDTGALDDEDASSNNAAAFLGYHGPVHEMGAPPAPSRALGR